MGLITYSLIIHLSNKRTKQKFDGQNFFLTIIDMVMLIVLQRGFRKAYNKQANRRSDLENHLEKESMMAYTMDTKVGEILKDAKAVEILEKHAPGVSKNPMIGMAKGMTLKQIVSMPQAKQAGLTEEMVVKVLGEINGLKK